MDGRLILDAPQVGAWNMALDQALLESVAQGDRPTLRLYRWRHPTLSLGYFQAVGERQQHGESGGLPVVRRATGGGAIVHDRECTYSLCLPIRDRASQAVRQIYDAAHGAIVATLKSLGVRVGRYADAPSPPPASAPAAPLPFLCFQRRTAEDLMLAGYKVVGSAQRRAAAAVLQHGSVLCEASAHAPQLPGLCELSGRAIGWDDLAATLPDRLGTALGIRWETASLPPALHQRAGDWCETRFADPRWNARR